MRKYEKNKEKVIHIIDYFDKWSKADNKTNS